VASRDGRAQGEGSRRRLGLVRVDIQAGVVGARSQQAPRPRPTEAVSPERPSPKSGLKTHT
jgi:hypothetical protein